MKKLTVILSVILLFAICLTACGETVENSVSDIAAQVSDVCGIEEPIELNEDSLLYDFGLTLDSVGEFAGYATNVTGSSGTVLAIRASADDIDSIVQTLEEYRATNADFLSNYPEFATAQSQAENGRVVTKGDVVVLAIAGADVDYADVDTAIDSALQ